MKRLTASIVLCAVLSIPLRGYAEEEILIGLVPEENIFKQMERYRPLAAYLSKKLGIKVRLTILSKYGDIIDRFASRKMDGAFFGAFTALLAVEKLSVEPVARAVNLDGTSTVESFIFVRSDSGIKSVKDMKGKRMAFVDRATVSGYLFAISFLRENGITNIDSFFKEYFFTGSHDSAFYSVLDNRADIGTAESKVFYRLIEKDPSIRNELTIIGRSPAFPGTILCLRKDMADRTRSRMREILFGMEKDPEGREVLKKYGALRFVATGKDDFSAVFEIAKKAGTDIKTYRYK
jgi:phosphonate transport system substrate-binding protein